MAAKTQSKKPEPPGLDVFLAALRWQESGSQAGDYTEGNGQGAYQIIQSNWLSWLAQYDPAYYNKHKPSDDNASHYPKSVQDKVARAKVTDYYYGAGEKNWRLVARIWNGGSPNPVPNPALGAGATTDTYATLLLDKANKIKNGAVDPTSAPSSSKSSASSSASANPAGTGGKTNCQHSIGANISFIKVGTLCLDKPLALVAGGFGVMLAFTGLAIMLVAGFEKTSAGRTATQALAVIPGAGGAVAKGASKAASIAPKARAAKATASAQTAASAEARRTAPSRAAARQDAAETRRQTEHEQRIQHRASAHIQRRSQVRGRSGTGDAPTRRRPHPAARVQHSPSPTAAGRRRQAAAGTPF